MKAARLAAAAALLAAGCSHCPMCGGEWGAAAASAAAAAAVQPQIVEVAGTVSCPERIAVLPTYSLCVKLRRSKTGETVAETSLSPIGSFPAFFALQYDAAGFDPDGSLCLSAELLSGDSAILRTDCDFCMRPGDETRGVDLVLSRISDTPAR